MSDHPYPDLLDRHLCDRPYEIEEPPVVEAAELVELAKQTSLEEF